MKKEIRIKYGANGVPYGANSDERESFLPPEVCPQEIAVDNSVRKENL